MLAAVVAALILQQAAGQAVVWSETPPPATEPTPSAAPAPTIPDWARADPYAYERAQCSPMIRKADESQEACQARVRVVLAANLGDALPAGLKSSASAEACRQEAAGDRYALQYGAPSRPDRPATALEERRCTTRPTVTGGAVSYQEDCSASTRPGEEDGLRIRLGDRD